MVGVWGSRSNSGSLELILARVRSGRLDEDYANQVSPGSNSLNDQSHVILSTYQVSWAVIAIASTLRQRESLKTLPLHSLA